MKEISEFYKYVRQVPLSGSAITLWHVLMQINNDARWNDMFTVPAVSLKPLHGLTDSTFKRARKELADKGYII
ncbi:hypothetical protein ACFSC5_13165 [Oceanobacillus bengalensis]|nr:hypothetical protein [Oceanobacillus bengalensis]